MKPYDRELETDALETQFLASDVLDMDRRFSEIVREHNEREDEIGAGFRAAEAEALEIPDLEIPEFEF